MRSKKYKSGKRGRVKRYAVSRSWRAVGFYRIENARGQALADASRVPFRWSDRDALVFARREDADREVARLFVGARVARELGVRVVRA